MPKRLLKHVKPIDTPEHPSNIVLEQHKALKHVLKWYY